jgi:hypothetical protein
VLGGTLVTSLGRIGVTSLIAVVVAMRQSERSTETLFPEWIRRREPLIYSNVFKKKEKKKKKVEQMNDDREYINGMSIGNIVSKKERKRY